MTARARRVPPARVRTRGEEPDGEVRGSHRPGHHEHAVHGLRPRRPGGQRGAEGARADLPEAGLGRARREGDLGAHAGGRRRGARRRPARAPTTSRASASPTSARPRWCGTSTTGEPIHNALVWQDTRTDKLVDEYSRDGGQARFQEKVGLPLATYFSGPKIRWMLDNVDGAADKAESGDLLFGNMDTWLIWNLTGGTDGGLHITDVDERQPHDADGPQDPRLGRGDHGRHGRPARRCCRRSRPRARSTARSTGRRARRRADRGRPRRPAGGDVRPDVLLARRGQEHVRHGQLPAAQHRHRGGAVEERPADHGRLQDRRPGRGLLPRGRRSPSPARSCSGCATTSR